MDDVRRRLYTPPVMIRLELHHLEDDDEEPSPPVPDGTEASGDGWRQTADDPAPPPPPKTVERGCLVPCFPGCHTPVYRAGRVITGHLLVRPLTRILISGNYSDCWCRLSRIGRVGSLII